MQIKKFLFSAFALLFFAGSFSSCLRDECTTTQTFIRFDPVYKTPAQVRTGVSVEGPRTLKKPGKIYSLDHYLFINEFQEGIHIIDNADPSNPRNIAFWNIGGNVDMAIRGNYLYADQYVDLLTINIQDFNNPTLVCRQQNAFRLHGFNPINGFLVDYVQTPVTETLDCADPRFGQRWTRNENGGFWISSDANAGIQTAGPIRNAVSVTGVSGSYARFGLSGDFLYTIDNSTLRTWGVNGSCVSRLDSTVVGWNIETIFPWKDRLFIGSQTGVFIFNNSNPRRPVFEASFSHATGCDPVVCDEKNAYVTIHAGTTCQGTFNQLDIIDITRLPSATLQKTYAMKKPKGLALSGKYLYLCDDGLKVFDRSTPTDMKQLSHVKGVDTYDVIALDDTHLLVIGADGFLQYDVTNPEKPKQISRISVN